MQSSCMTIFSSVMPGPIPRLALLYAVAHQFKTINGQCLSLNKCVAKIIWALLLCHLNWDLDQLK